MKILMCSYLGYGASFVPRFLEEGHTTDYYFYGPKPYDQVLDGIVDRINKKPDFSKYDLVLFDLTGKPALAEEAAKVTNVIGDGNFQSEIEDNRLLGIQIMEQAGINVPPYEQFNDINEAKRFIRKTKKRYVFKPDGGQTQDAATTYVGKSAEDLLDFLDKLSTMSKGTEFILQEFIEGTEISTEAYFNGEEFYLVNATLEEKKFLNENLGPNTGCSGNLVWVYDSINKPYIFREGLEKMKDFLQQYNFRGMIDLNTIVTPTKLYGLEWTPRFGYDASYTLYSLIESNLGEFLGAIASGAKPDYQLRSKFSVALRLTVPPYPSEIEGKHPDGIPISGLELDNCVKDCYLYDICLDRHDTLVTAGVNGYVCCPVAYGETIEQSWGRLKDKVKGIHIPDMQYRTDLQQTTIKRYRSAEVMGWLR